MHIMSYELYIEKAKVNYSKFLILNHENILMIKKIYMILIMYIIKHHLTRNMGKTDLNLSN